MKKIIIILLATLALGAGFGCGKTATTDSNQALITANENEDNNDSANIIPVDENQGGRASFYIDFQEIDALSDDVNATSRNIDTQFNELDELDTGDDEIEI